MADTETAKEKATRNRNPAYPAMDLPTAIERAQVLYDQESRKPMKPETACLHWGYTIKSSTALQTISALKQYGLLLDERDDTVRKLRLSQIALTILLDKREESQARAEALCSAALSPTIYAELWAKADEDGSLPSDIELNHYLLLERKQPFYDEAIPGLIRDFKSTIAFAKLGKHDIIDGNEGDHDDDKNSGSHPPDSKVKGMPAIDPPKDKQAVVRDLTFPLIGGNAAILRVPIPLSEENFGLLTSILQTMKAAIVSKPAEE